MLTGCMARDLLPSKPVLPTQRYVPVGSSADRLGAVELNATQLRMDGRKGEMRLEYVGQMPELEESNLTGGSVYRIRNAEDYFEDNRDDIARCSQTPQWLVINSSTGAPAWSEEIWLAFLSVDDWQKYRPDSSDYCAGGKFVRTTSN